ncbi:carbohydrate ABC transporter permease [Jiangella sp. DSM 45060]|uniref:carbohydrate ABC transporter permease n=1 Tax=Jiangella sp. DSM 45060 TaxID=1798224 RepID=UPI00087DF0B4|nr:carbohydrate ABC transporter permease [Jiangella sp. DSM 45060]SDT17649.1 carbohydrate ABC transporter membrane protein 2, CUT1 family [Jiangella sp. DSM 45060]
MSAVVSSERVVARASPARKPADFFRAGQYVMLVVVVLVADLPLVFMIFSAFRTEAANKQYPPGLDADALTLENFTSLFGTYGFGKYLQNSLVVSGVATAGVVILGTIAAYALSRFDFLPLRVVGRMAIVAYLIPPILILVPVTQVIFGAGLGDNLIALAALYTAVFLPFALWMLRSYFQGVAVQLEEAAMVDGCTRFGAFRRVVVPIAVPGVITAGIFTFAAAWSEYLYASTLMTSTSNMTANPATYLLMGHYGTTSAGLLMAAGLVIVAPVVVLYLIAQRWLVSGLAAGAVKG